MTKETKYKDARAVFRAALPLCLALFACVPSASEITVLIVNRREAALSDVRVISGGDKVYFKQIDSGADMRVIMDPGRTSDYQVTLFYTLLDRPTIWDSDHLPAGNNYFIEISVTGEGVETRHCTKPCE